MSPGDLDRFQKCLALAERGATAGERAAAYAAAERIAASAGMTLAKAKEKLWPAQPHAGQKTSRSRRTYAWAQPTEPVKPVTVEELRRQKAETEAWRKRATAAADRKLRKHLAEEEAYWAQQRAMQAERDREWAQSRGL